MSLRLLFAAGRPWRYGIGLVVWGGLAACQPGEATTTTGGAAPAAPETSGPAAAGATTEPATQQGTVTFTIDGRPEPGVSCALLKTGSKSGFRVTFSSEQSLDVQIADHGQLPLAVGKVALLDWTTSAVQLTASALAPRFSSEVNEDHGAYFSYLGIEEGPSADFLHVYDWGAGAQRLRGREVGQLVFARIANGTADGSFQSAVYIQTGPSATATYQGRDRVLHRMKEHLLKGTFKDVPVFDMQKALRGEQ